MINADEKYRVLSADGFDSALEQQLLSSLDVNLYKTDLEIVFPYIIIKSNNGNFDMIRIIIMFRKVLTLQIPAMGKCVSVNLKR